MEARPASQVEVFRAHDKGSASERALVLQARNMPHALVHHEGLWRLFVPVGFAQAAFEELSHYNVENVDWPPKEEAPPLRSRGIFAVSLYALILLLAHPAGQRGLFGFNLWESGRMEASAVRAGEWWRTVTALTLHVDGSHLAGNLAIGAIFSIFAAHLMGAGLTWLCILLSGALGNLANAYLQADGFRSVGASTAVFGALGLLTAFEWTRRRILRLSPLRRIAPILGAAVLVGYLGVGGSGSGLESTGRVDVIAHLTGFGAGVLLGLGVGRSRLPEFLGPRGQQLLGALCLALLALAWFAGLSMKG